MQTELRYIFNIFCISLAILIITGCQQQQKSDLDIIKAFKPEDKYFKSSLMSLHFIIETSPIDRVDSSFQQIIDAYQLPISAKGVPDGTYSAATPADAFDYQHVVTISVKNERITSVDYNEIKQSGKGKQEDPAYCKEMQPAGTTPAIAYPIMEQQLLEKQNIMDVDAVSGATYSLYRMRYALTMALMKARIENNKK
ncbi:FMN-binding protein [Marinilabilia salmonicolor]|uniref:Major membrane immunogen (Membrane-anchored lipoprotein) n=2 Tax=Marinilabilia salmonicolor TaxID=989 RepID=A0A2T0XS49_9BACT|nr:FMN-binding protein [Marinilabilia salmonicolor]PRZ01702.1 major membrane immunogen (membrane-anchored lipoprotein) [Marinilabilia salmonicolor]RCW31641.1 major membrane immunogen (membrane-anchored lipoprotein) [Marinilabilia salmonicolor]